MPRTNVLKLFSRSTKRSWDVNCDDLNEDHEKGQPQPPTQASSHRLSSSSKDASNWEKFKLLLWKNYKIQMRHKFLTLLEIILPILFTVVLVVVRCVIESKVVTQPTIYPPFELSAPPATPQQCCNQLFYSPKNNMTDKLMELVQRDFFNQSQLHYSIQGFDTEDELEKSFTATSGKQSQNETVVKSEDEDAAMSPSVLAGIVFTNAFPDGDFPTEIKYKLRFPATPRGEFDFFEDRFGIKKIWFTEILFPVVQLFGPRAPEKITGGVPGYYDEGFLYLQYSIETTLAKLLLKNESLLENYNIELQRFPYPNYIDDKFLFTLQGILPLVLVLSFIFPVINITKLVVVEKERRLKEYMKMMGLPNWLHWTAWFLKSFSFLAISTLLITLLLKIRFLESQILAILPNTDATLIYFAIITHIFQLICFAFFVSTLFKTANSAAIVAAILWFLFFIPFAFIQPRYNILSRELKILWCVGTNLSICFSCQLFCMFEGTGVGAQWSTLFQGATPDDTFCLADCIMVMIFNGVMYLLLTLYIEVVWPGEYGIPQPWYFLFTKRYWTGKVYQQPRASSNALNGISNVGGEYFEDSHPNSAPGIQIKGLTKKFGNSKIAVKNLNLTLYENEIFVLLGHNAAGKTTTMSLLAGIFPPTSGTAWINGYDICSDIKAVRQSLGLCPQSNVLFSELTVQEHLQFFCTLKGLKKSEVNGEVKRMIIAIGLEDKKNTVAQALSGGMKRRLSVGIAFCAGSKVVLLDEPSSGLDPGARRAIWDLIQGEKKGRTILLSTHYMDEADILAERIAIMAEGEIQCCGTSLFLKKKYGCGYHLVIVKEPTCSAEKITTFLKKALDEVEEGQHVGAELSYALPEYKSHLFAEIFEELERRKVEFGIASYGASITTMEEVFSRVGQLLHGKNRLLPLTVEKGSSSPKSGKSSPKRSKVSLEGSPNPKSKSGLLEASSVTFLNGSKMSVEKAGVEIKMVAPKLSLSKKNIGTALLFQQFRAMVIKKLLFIVRKPGLLMGTIAMPAIYLTVINFILTTVPGFHDPPSHPLVLDDYEIFGRAITTLKCQEDSPVCEGYKIFLEHKHKLFQLVPQNLTFGEDLIKKAETDLPFVNFKYLIGFNELAAAPNSTNKTQLIGLFNNQPLHTPPLALNFITNALLNAPNPYANSSNYTVELTNHPFKYGTSNVEEFGTWFTVGFQIGLHLALAMGFMTAIYSIFPIKERTLGSKHLQFVSGGNFVLYWTANFLVDLVAYALPCLAVHLILIAYAIPDFYSVDVQLYLLLILYSFAFAVLPMMYLSSLVFRIPSSGLVGMGVFNVFTGFATIFVVTILENPELKKQALATILHRIFLVFPTYALGKGITQISVNYQLGKACGGFQLEFFCEAFPDSYCCTKLKSDYLDWEELGIGRNLVYLSTFGILSWILLLLLESNLFTGLYNHARQKIDQFKGSKAVDLNGSSYNTEDSNVRAERLRIQNASLPELFASDNLLIRDLSKTYANGTRAVDHINLGVKKGECVGLLGANGAGKTSTFKMLTGELPITSGNGYICSNSIRTELKQAHKNIGYCPQFDCLIEELTGRETLTMYARLRGIAEADIEHIVQKLAGELLFTEFLDKPVMNYSGGNKRKLSTAVALVGDPAIVFLDEPTCGIDPVARRHLWECIIRIRDAGTSVILTSHSMEETEFLCTRLAIMVNGKFRCLGSPQQLKSKFGEGYTLTCQTHVDPMAGEAEDTKGTWRRLRRQVSYLNAQELWRSKLEGLRLFIEESLPGCMLEDIHEGFLHYRVQSNVVTWGQMFTVMEAAKEKFKVEAYSVGQTSLEQVFLNFIKAQVPSEMDVE